MQAVSVVSREVMAPRGLVGMARETVDHSGEEIARVGFFSFFLSFTPTLHPLLRSEENG